MVFDPVAFENREFVIRCNSEEEAKSCIEFLYAHGFAWISQTVNDTFWGICDNYIYYHSAPYGKFHDENRPIYCCTHPDRDIIWFSQLISNVNISTEELFDLICEE